MKYPLRKHIPSGPDNFLSVLEGIEGGFAIFTGIVAGLSFQISDRRLLIITGLIGIIASAFNSSAVRYSTQHYLDELDGHEKRNKTKYYLLPAIVEFIAYVLVAGVAILPLLLIDSLPLAVITCSAITVGVLFVAGYYKGWLLRMNPLRDALELSLLGAMIILLGAGAGYGLALL